MDAIGNKIIIPGLAFLSIFTIGSAVLIIMGQRKKTLESKLEKDSWTVKGAKETHKVKSGLLQFLEKIGNIASHGRASTELWEELVRAGFFSSAAPSVYTGIKMLFFCIGIACTAAMVMPMKLPGTTKLTYVFMGGTFIFFIPNILLKIRLEKRQSEIRQHLPEAIDMLEICVSSGIGLSMAWNLVTDEIQHVSPILANAMGLTNFEIHLGVSRVEAMRHMATRTGVDRLSSLAAILVQTERFGTSIATTLKVFATSMREDRFFEVEEHAEKVAAKLIIPMILFIFPAIFIVVIGPAVLTLVQFFQT
ncbi:MAG: type II secretion system F family protein [Planctomycetota bacterium]|jgi:tight adherence protein C